MRDVCQIDVNIAFQFHKNLKLLITDKFFIGNASHLSLQMQQRVPMPHFQLFLFVCYLFLAINRKASSFPGFHTNYIFSITRLGDCQLCNN